MYNEKLNKSHLLDWIKNPPKAFDFECKIYPNSTDTSFLFLTEFYKKDGLTNLKGETVSKMYYAGRSTFKKKLYLGSASDENFKPLIIDSSVKKKLTILDFGTTKNMQKAEWEYLDKNNSVESPLWYNKQNNFDGGVRKQDWKAIDNLAKDFRILKQFWNESDSVKEVKEKELTYLSFDMIQEPVLPSFLDGMDNAQVRAQVKIQENITKIQTMLDCEVDDQTIDKLEKFRPPIVLKDREWLNNTTDEIKSHENLLICGKHTSTAYATHDMACAQLIPWVQIPPSVHTKFSDIEIKKAAGQDNAPDLATSPYNIDDALEDMKETHLSGNSWNCNEEKIRIKRLLQKDSWSTLVKKMNLWLDELESEESGTGKWIGSQWSEGEYLEEVEDMISKGNKNSKEFHVGPFSSETVNLQKNILKPYNRYSEKSSAKTIKVYVYHPNIDSSAKRWEKDSGNKKEILNECLPYMKKGLKIDFVLLQERTKSSVS